MTTSSKAQRQALLTMAGLLCMQPLWRVQVNNQRERDESCAQRDAPAGRDRLPFYFFQRVVDDRLELRSSGGNVHHVHPLDVCDVIPCLPLVVQAMPRRTFLARIAIPAADRQGPAPLECFEPAHVLYAQKDRFGNARAAVSFLDPALNAGPPCLATLTDEDQRRLQRLARRTVMPVMGPGSANYSADHGVSMHERRTARLAASFIASALAGRNPNPAAYV